MYYIGFDIGSSSIKASLVEAESKKSIATVSYPDEEMAMIAVKAGWAEQNPEDWWNGVCESSKRLLQQSGVDGNEVVGIGLGYQMHGLVLVDKSHQVLRPSIIWCDGRSVGYGESAFKEIGEQKCLSHLLNSPGNFTASKLKWVKENEPQVFHKVYKMMLPGDYIAMKMTGEIFTTISGLSEGIFWDFKENKLADFLLDHYGIRKDMIPEALTTFQESGGLSEGAAKAMGLKSGTVVAYRAGDQPNNALALGVLEPGDIAATGGTSGVVYSVSDQLVKDEKSRINGFAHVNHTTRQTRIGSLLCINGTGIQHRWIKQQIAGNATYGDIEKAADSIPVGSDGVSILPFGNGAERMFENKEVGGHVLGLNFNRHKKEHLFRAGLEGIAFSFVYGVDILKESGGTVSKMKVGNDNLFQSRIFSETIATLLNCEIELIETTGATGAAQAVGYTLGHVKKIREALGASGTAGTINPHQNSGPYHEAYQAWKRELKRII